MTFSPQPDPLPPTGRGTTPPADPAVEVLGRPAPANRLARQHARTATWLLATETGAAADTAADVADAAERVCYRLCGRVSRLVTTSGSHALLSRALHLSRPDYGFLERVHAGIPPEPALGGLDVVTREVDPRQTELGLIAVVATLLDLLVAFIGEDLTMRLVREVWPDLPLLESSQAGSSDRQDIGKSDRQERAS